MLRSFGIAIVFVAVLASVGCLLNQGTISGRHQDKLITELIQNVSSLNQAVAAAAAREQANMADLIKANIQLQQNFSKFQQTISDQQQKLEHLEMQVIYHNRNNTVQHQRIIELESAEIDNNKTITELQQRIYELEKETVYQNMTNAVQQHKIDEMEQAAIIYTKAFIRQQQKIDELENVNSGINRTLNMHQLEMDSRLNSSFGAYQVMLQDIVEKYNQHESVFNNQSIALNQSVADLGKQFHYLSLFLSDTEKKINASLTGTYELIDQQVTSN